MAGLTSQATVNVTVDDAPPDAAAPRSEVIDLTSRMAPDGTLDCVVQSDDPVAEIAEQVGFDGTDP